MARKFMGLAFALVTAAGITATTAPAQTLDEIKARGEIRVGMLVDFPPFGILDLQGQPDGYDADVAKLLAADLGVEVKLVPVTGPNRIPYLLSSQVDVLVASLGITEARAQQVEFSQPYAGIGVYVVGDVATKVAGPEDLAGQSVGVARASTQDTALTGLAPEGADIKRFDDDASAVQALISGQVPMIGCSNTVIQQIDQVAPGRFDIKFALSQQSQGIATRPGATDLMAAINAFITKAKDSGELNALHEKWAGEPLPDFVAKAQ